MDSQLIPVKRCYQSGNRDKSTVSVKKQIPGVRATGEDSDVLGEQSVISCQDIWWVILPPVLQLSHTHRV